MCWHRSANQHFTWTWAPSQYINDICRWGSHYVKNTAVRPSYLYNGNTYIGNIVSLYCDGSQISTRTWVLIHETASFVRFATLPSIIVIYDISCTSIVDQFSLYDFGKKYHLCNSCVVRGQVAFMCVFDTLNFFSSSVHSIHTLIIQYPIYYHMHIHT